MSEYGKKYICKCGCKFYDLNRPEAICPRCELNLKKADKKSKHGKLLKEIVDDTYVSKKEDVEESSDGTDNENDNVSADTPDEEAAVTVGADDKKDHTLSDQSDEA